MPGVLMDGQDVVTVYEAVREAVAYARAGQARYRRDPAPYGFHDYSEGLNRVVRDVYRTEEKIDRRK